MSKYFYQFFFLRHINLGNGYIYTSNEKGNIYCCKHKR